MQKINNKLIKLHEQALRHENKLNLKYLLSQEKQERAIMKLIRQEEKEFYGL